MVMDMKDRSDAISHVQVGLTLRAVTEHVKILGVRLELLAEVEDGAVCAAHPDHIAEATDIADQAEALDIRRDECLTRELARAVQRDGQVSQIHLSARLGG